MSGAPPPPMPSYEPVAPAAEVRQVDRNESTFGRTVDDIVRDATKEAQTARQQVDNFTRRHPDQVERTVDLSNELEQSLFDGSREAARNANLPREQREKAEREAKQRISRTMKRSR